MIASCAASSASDPTLWDHPDLSLTNFLYARLSTRYRSGASATGCRHEVELGERYLNLRQNPVLGEAQFQPVANGAPSISTTFFLISPPPLC